MPKPSESELSKPSRSDSRETSKQVCVVRHLAMVQKLPWTQKETEWSPRANDERCARVSINISSLDCRVTLQSFDLPCRLAIVASAAHCRYLSIWDCWASPFGESPSNQEHLLAVFKLSFLLSTKLEIYLGQFVLLLWWKQHGNVAAQVVNMQEAIFAARILGQLLGTFLSTFNRIVRSRRTIGECVRGTIVPI